MSQSRLQAVPSPTPRVEVAIEPDAERTVVFLREWIEAAARRKAAREESSKEVA